MPKKVSQERIVYALKQAEAGVKPSEICRENGISEQTFYNWKRKYGGMGVSELRVYGFGRREPEAEAACGGPDLG